jgi:hypothetical protein
MITSLRSKASAAILAVIGAALGGTIVSGLVGMAFLATIFA